jgi:hypothetical protein
MRCHRKMLIIQPNKKNIQHFPEKKLLRIFMTYWMILFKTGLILNRAEYPRHLRKNLAF